MATAVPTPQPAAGVDDEGVFSSMQDLLSMPVAPDAFHDWCARIARIPLLPESEIRDLIERAQRGDREARNRAWTHNLKLVVKYALRYGRNEEEWADLIQDGNINLVRAIAKFDLLSGWRFSTYAVWWIKQAMKREGPKMQHTVHIPSGAYEKACQGGAPPIPTEYSLSIPPPNVKGDGDGSQWEDVIPDPDEGDIDALADALDCRALWMALREHLTAEERRVLVEHRVEGRTLPDIGADVGHSRTYAWQVEQRALAILRKHIDRAPDGSPILRANVAPAQ